MRRFLSGILVLFMMALPACGASGGSSTVAAVVAAIVQVLVPDSGQTTSYTATVGEDNDYSINTPSYTDNGDGTITDNVTSLIWQKCSMGFDQTDFACTTGAATTDTWTNAGTYCAGLTLGGSSSWRLPEISELHSIGNNEPITGPMIDAATFPATATNFYWSATIYAPTTANAFYVDFNSGGVGSSIKSNANGNVRCVR